MHQAEYYAWQGNLKGAIDQLQIASKDHDGDFYAASMVDSRLRQYKREAAEQTKPAFGRAG
jgi:predicted Zn-dependent protease